MAVKRILFVFLTLFVFQASSSTTLWEQWNSPGFVPNNVNWTPPTVINYFRNIYVGDNVFESLMYIRSHQYLWRRVSDLKKYFCQIESYLDDSGLLCHRNPKYWDLSQISSTCKPTIEESQCIGNDCCFPPIPNTDYQMLHVSTYDVLDPVTLNWPY